MTDEEIRTAAAEKLAADRKALANASETTPPKMTTAVAQFASTLSTVGPLYIPVVHDPHGRYGWCSDGVRLKVNADGGEPVYGWTIWEWPPVLLTAEFHCVWRAPTGELLDITPKPQRETTIVFVEDPRVPPDFDFDLRPGNRRVRLYEAQDRAAQVEAMADKLQGSQLEYESRRAAKAGLSLRDWLDRKIPVDPLPESVDALIAACGAYEQFMDAAGPSGEVTVDRFEFMNLVQRRVSAETTLKGLLKNASK